jgi:ABC-2 type transport system permease protein
MTASLPCLAASLIASLAAAQSASDLLLLIFLPQTFVIMASFAGISVNLSFPKLDWVNEVQVVKQSLSSMIVMLGSMALLVGLGLIYYALRNAISLIPYLWICAGVFAIAAFGFYRYLQTGGSKKFAELQLI